MERIFGCANVNRNDCMQSTLLGFKSTRVESTGTGDSKLAIRYCMDVAAQTRSEVKGAWARKSAMQPVVNKAVEIGANMFWL
jgi:hypothetical protein